MEFYQSLFLNKNPIIEFQQSLLLQQKSIYGVLPIFISAAKIHLWQLLCPEIKEHLLHDRTKMVRKR
jgi:hypothetical protein